MKPTWWLLYAIGVSLVGLSVVELTVPEEGLRVVLLSFVVVIGFAPRRLDRPRVRGARKRERFRAAPDARGDASTRGMSCGTGQESRAPDLTLNAGGPRALH